MTQQTFFTTKDKYMNVLVIRNLPFDLKSTIELFLIDKKIPHTLIQPLKGEKIPDTSNFDAMVIMGGLMGAYEGDIYPFINEEISIAKDFILSEKKILGLCLGAQIMAASLDARVYKGHKKEAGWFDMNINDQITYDEKIKIISTNPQTNNMDKTVKILNWHGDTFDLPANVERIGSTNLYTNQGFKYKNNAYALQFHLEVTEDMINSWMQEEDQNTINPDKIKYDTDNYLKDFQTKAYSFYNSFFDL